MKQAVFLALFAALVLTGIYTVVTVYDNTLKVGRMNQTQVIRPYESPLLITDNKLLAFDQSEALIHEKLDKQMPGELAGTRQEILDKGRKDYMSFCSQCHGKNLNGLGTVGQSFSPLPTDLAGEKAVKLSDKELFTIISYGTKKTPALASSMTVESRQAVIRYIRSRQNMRP